MLWAAELPYSLWPALTTKMLSGPLTGFGHWSTLVRRRQTWRVRSQMELWRKHAPAFMQTWPTIRADTRPSFLLHREAQQDFGNIYMREKVWENLWMSMVCLVASLNFFWLVILTLTDAEEQQLIHLEVYLEMSGTHLADWMMEHSMKSHGHCIIVYFNQWQ